MNSAPRYVIVTPVRNEGEHFARTIESVTSQTLRPAEWIIVDDGSSDVTPHLALDAGRRFPWIRLVQKTDRGFRQNGAGVVQSFQQGINALQVTDWAFLVKLDGDLCFGANYFTDCVAAFGADSKLGIVGGDIVHVKDGQFVIESRSDPAFHVRGANKMYSRACWNAIGGVHNITGWDTMDELKANMLGFRTRRLPHAPVTHLKPTGNADGRWRNAVKNGRGSYICGYHPLFLLARSARSLRQGAFTNSIGLLTGYLSSLLTAKARVPDPELIRYTRSHQMRRLLGKPSLWQP